MKSYTVGVDVGGTRIKFGLVNRSGSIISRAFLDTKQFSRSRQKLINEIILTISKLIHDKGFKPAQILGIGIGLPGLIDSKKGIVHVLPNISGWKNVPLKRIIQAKLRIPTFVDNDVNIITLGEWKYGAGKGYKNMVCMTLGTGVGSGLIINDALYRGEGFAAGELGHMPINEKGPKCSCGGFGCFERYVGNRQLQKKARKIFRRKNIDMPDIYPLASRGDRRALKFWDDTAVHIGNGLIGVINLLNPRLIVIGGGVSNNFRFMSSRIRKIIKERSMDVQGKMVRVVRAKLGDDAGIIGAQVLVKEVLGKRI